MCKRHTLLLFGRVFNSVQYAIIDHYPWEIWNVTIETEYAKCLINIMP